jgi:hypothetical protein
VSESNHNEDAAADDNTTEATEARQSADAIDGASDADDGFPSPDELIGHFMQETALWPVFIVAIVSGGALGAAMLVLAWVDRNPFAAAALLLVLGMSVDVVIQARRKALYRNIAKLVALLWCSAIALAGVGVWTGIAL